MPKIPKSIKGDVAFYSPNSKRKSPIVYSTKATSDFLAIVASMNTDATVQELREILTDKTKWILNTEAVKVCDAYIEKGFGTWVPQWR